MGVVDQVGCVAGDDHRAPAAVDGAASHRTQRVRLSRRRGDVHHTCRLPQVARDAARRAVGGELAARVGLYAYRRGAGDMEPLYEAAVAAGAEWM